MFKHKDTSFVDYSFDTLILPKGVLFVD